MAATKRSNPPTQPLNVFLLKTGTRRYEDALEVDEIAGLARYPLNQTLPFKGALFLAPQQKSPPRWLGFLENGVRGDLQRLYNASTSAVLFIRSAKRTFAFTFGYGRSLLQPMRIERAFGLRVVLNTVDEEGLRSVDTKTVQELTVHTRRQTSRASRLADFGVDKEEDLVGSVAGVPRDAAFARMLSGADSLQFRAPVEFDELGEKCRAILQAYRRDDYKRRGFAFVDHVRKVTDPTLIEALDGDLADALVSRDFDGIHMAPPEMIDWASVDGFSFTRGADPEPDLRLASFFDQIRKVEEITVERLKQRQKVFVHLANAAKAVAKWSVYRVLVAERERKSRRYALSGGDWYEIEKGFAQKIERRVAKIKSAGLRLPAAGRDEKESEYNARVSGRGIYCLDRKCARTDGDPIELCDLYTSSPRQFVHVKRWTASATLSHLFAQGRISAEIFLTDATFRDEARVLLSEQAYSLASHVPSSRPDTTKYRVVFGIIKGGQGWKQSLPFFSQLHLVRSAESIRRLGFDVRLEKIKVED